MPTLATPADDYLCRLPRLRAVLGVTPEGPPSGPRHGPAEGGPAMSPRTTPRRSRVEPLDELAVRLGHHCPDGLVVRRIDSMLRAELGLDAVTMFHVRADGDRFAVLLAQREHPASPYRAYAAHVLCLEETLALAVAALAGEGGGEP